MEIVKRNRIRCLLCGDVIESRYTHEMVSCSCGAVAVDGGHDYCRRSFVSRDAYEELSEWAYVPDEELPWPIPKKSHWEGD